MPRLLALPLAALLGLGLTVVPPVLAEPPSAPPRSETGEAASAFGRGHLHDHGPDGLELDRRGRARTVVAEPVDTTLQDDAWRDRKALPVVAVNQRDTSALSQVHLVYLHGSEAKPRTEFLRMFEADARSAQAFLQSEHGRSVRFDEAASGQLDITTVKSRYRTSQLGGSTQFDLVKRELARVFPDSESPRKKYVAWLDAPSSYCGQGELYGDWHRDRENWNDLRTTGVVYRPFAANGADGGFCRGRTLLHELGHNLGAIYGKAPNAFDGAHCSDDKNDVMCYQSAVTSGVTSTGDGAFDYRNDDYWDAGASTGSLNGDHVQHLNWWGANLSRFVCRPSVADGPARCDDPATHLASDEELRYHAGNAAYPPPPAPPTG